MNYFGEHLLPGQLGQFFIVLSLVASIVATFAYFKATKSKDVSDAGYWKKLARYAFITETISVIAIFSSLFYIIHNHLFEYRYAWQHSSLALEFKYMLACFWEGQEGSFLLWSFWHCILGLVLIKTSKQWEAPVMTIVSFAQVCLATMIAGLYIFNWRMGSNPFILLKDTGVLDNASNLHVNADITQPLKQNYVSAITDGNGLNPLLQNYWMVIHPPVLFLGFASTIVPFAFAVAGLWLKKFGEWVKVALPWALFSSAVLGVGIMMGAAWAYESLTFGGYWAWDPVENASLVPWLILIAGVHTLLIYKHSGHSLRSAHLFLILAFGFVLYSTFLTRSGILGDSSVHAFTDLGMNIQLYMLLYLFIWLPAFFAAKNRNDKMITSITGALLLALTFLASNFFINAAAVLSFATLIAGIGFIIYHIQIQVPTIKKEESASSREFWMFIGSLVFFLSALVIIGKTSLPVLNKILNLTIAAPEDQEFAYNQIQIFVAIIVAVLTGFTQYLKYKSTSTKFFWKKIFIPTLIAVALAVMVVAFGNINYDKKGPMYLGAILLGVACSIYAIIANAAYIFIGVKNRSRFFVSLLFFLFALSIFLIICSPSIKVKFNSDFGSTFFYDHTNLISLLSAGIGLSTLILQVYLNRKHLTNLLLRVIFPLVCSVLLSFAIVNVTGAVYVSSTWIVITLILYALIVSVVYLSTSFSSELKDKLLLSGGSIAHFGFGLVLLGILLSSSKKEILSYNTTNIFVPLEENKLTGKAGENITLVKGLKTDMGKYWVTFESSEKQANKDKWFYSLRFQRKDGKEEFVLKPSAFINLKGEGMQANPDSRHYLDHDVFTYLTALPNPQKQEDTTTFKTKLLKPGDSLFYSKGFIILKDVIKEDNLPVDIFGKDGSVHDAPLKIYSKTGSIFSVTSKLVFVKGQYLPIPDTIIAENLVLQLQKVNPDKSVELGVKESNAVMEYVTLKAYKFPFINVLWAGIIITAIGILMSMVRRIRLNRSGKAGS
jgi:cytochrome c biogenesis factor